MGYAIRLFCIVPLSTLVPLQAQMIQRGFRVQPVGTNQLDIFFDPNQPPITADLLDVTQSETGQQIADFLEAVSKLDDSPEKNRVLDVLSRTQALVIVGITEDRSDAFPAALDNILDVVSNSAEGLFQVDGEGFYEHGSLILPLK